MSVAFIFRWQDTADDGVFVGVVVFNGPSALRVNDFCQLQRVFIVAVLPAVAFTVRSRHRQIKRAVLHCPDNTVTVRVRQQVAVAVIAKSFRAGSSTFNAAQFMVLLPL